MRRLIFMALLGVLCISFGSVAWAQRLDGTLRVTITDKSQASIEDAKVTVENEATGVSAATTTSSAGTYVFPNLLVGTYAVTVEKDGFKKAGKKLDMGKACIRFKKLKDLPLDVISDSIARVPMENYARHYEASRQK